MLRRGLLGVLMVCGVVLAGCQNATPPAPPRKSAVVKFAYPVEQQVTDSEEFTGRTEAVSVDRPGNQTSNLARRTRIRWQQAL